ncbi:Hypothetical protein, putative [Bodo saltans]|uniref:Uncharacterized protein n=1 Tax=Bodo saltans TaxID=75058 RepID=A0A0S4ING0_BODSA|nr:Hypothetical protein, putative [Bodo saltans]|eukprot:CUE87315.1 Hypothetical protein, putative [Bodo saltans]
MTFSSNCRKLSFNVTLNSLLLARYHTIHTPLSGCLVCKQRLSSSFSYPSFTSHRPKNPVHNGPHAPPALLKEVVVGAGRATPAKLVTPPTALRVAEMIATCGSCVTAPFPHQVHPLKRLKCQPARMQPIAHHARNLRVVGGAASRTSAKAATRRVASTAAPFRTGRGLIFSARQRHGQCATSITDIATAASPRSIVVTARQLECVRRVVLLAATQATVPETDGYGVKTRRATRTVKSPFTGVESANSSDTFYLNTTRVRLLTNKQKSKIV